MRLTRKRSMSKKDRTKIAQKQKITCVNMGEKQKPYSLANSPFAVENGPVEIESFPMVFGNTGMLTRVSKPSQTPTIHPIKSH